MPAKAAPKPPEDDRHHKEIQDQMDIHHQLAEAVRAACVEAALQSYEDAKISGLCHEGAWECAVSAIRTLDLDPIIAKMIDNL